MHTFEIRFHSQTIYVQHVFIDGEKKYGIHPSTLATLVNTYQTALSTLTADSDSVEEKLIEHFEKEGYQILSQLEGEEVQNSGNEFELSFIYQVESEDNFYQIMANHQLILSHPAVKSSATF